MEFTTDLSALGWLKPVFYSRAAWEALRVKHMLPESYEQYFELLPAVGILEDFPFEQVQPHSAAIDQINRNVAIWTRYGVYLAGRQPAYQPTTFRQLATQFGLSFDENLVRQLPWGKRGFATLNELTANRLRHLLQQLAPAVRLTLYIEDYWRYGPMTGQLLPTDDEVLYRATAAGFVAFLQQASFDATAYLFPDDRSWCLVNREDGLGPILGCSAAAARAVATRSGIELLQLTPDSLLF